MNAIEAARRQELVQELENAKTDFEKVLNEVGKDRLEEPGVVGTWSVKDILAHMTAWEERILAWAAAVQAGGRPKPPAWSGDWSEEQVNAFIYERNRERSAPEVLLAWRQTHERVLAALEAMDDETLFGREVEWLGGSFGESLGGNSYEHLQHHAGDIRAWLAEKEDA